MHMFSFVFRVDSNDARMLDSLINGDFTAGASQDVSGTVRLRAIRRSIRIQAANEGAESPG